MGQTRPVTRRAIRCKHTLVLDLCAGLGGASAAFDKKDVVTVDIERRFKPSIVADVQNLPIRTNLGPDLVIFSPPCQCFSILSVRYHWGNVPFRMLNGMKPWPKIPRGDHGPGSVQGELTGMYASWPRRKGTAWVKYRASAERAKWPLGLSQAVREAVDR